MGRAALGVAAMGLVHKYFTADKVAAWLAESCASQDAPVAISDPVTLARVVTLLGGGEPGAAGERDRAPEAARASPTAATPA